jgi:predicted Zn-dependent peptidase
LADHQFIRVAFGGHPYSYIETPETVEAITRNDIRTFHRTYYRPNNALLIIVGDLTPEEAQAHAERAFGLWMPAEVPELFDYPEMQPADTSVIYLVDRPDSEQATIHLGNVGIDARNPDRYALEVVNSLLGSGSSSRLYLNLREEKGYTYGVFSRFARPNDAGTFRVVGDFNEDAAAASITEILNELERVRTEPIGEEELENAKGKIIGGFALAMEDPAVYASQLAVRALTGVPIEELDEYLPSLEAVTAEEAQAAAAQYIDSESPIIVVVGNAQDLKPQLEEIMPVVVVDGDGNVVEE